MILDRFRNAQIGRTLTMALLLFEFSACNNNDGDAKQKRDDEKGKSSDDKSKKRDEAFAFKIEYIADQKHNQKAKTTNFFKEETTENSRANKFYKLNRGHCLKVLRHFDAEFQAYKRALIELEGENKFAEPTKKRNKKLSYRRAFSRQIKLTQMLGRDPILSINPTDGPLQCDPIVDAISSRFWNDEAGIFY